MRPILLSDHSFGQPLPEGLNHTEHSYLQVVKRLIGTDFSRMWDVLEGSWFVCRSQGRKKSLKNEGPKDAEFQGLQCCQGRVLPLALGFEFVFCAVSCCLRKGLCSHPLAP